MTLPLTCHVETEMQLTWYSDVGTMVNNLSPSLSFSLLSPHHGFLCLSTIVDDLQIHMNNCLMNHSHRTTRHSHPVCERGRCFSPRLNLFILVASQLRDQPVATTTSTKKLPKVNECTQQTVIALAQFDFFLSLSLSPFLLFLLVSCIHIVCALNDSSVKPMTRGGQGKQQHAVFTLNQ